MVGVRVLGPLGADVDGVPADLGGPRRRAVLAHLALAAGAVVSTDRLLEDLWPGEAPPRALAALQVHVSHLRRALEPARAPRAPARVLVSVPPGYALRAESDAARAAELIARAREEPSERAAATLREALACWTGPVLAEVADQPWAAPEVERLEELRRSAVEALAAAELAFAPPQAAVAALRAHVHAHPLREEAVRLLAVALRDGGRRADARAVLADTRRRLRDELGLEPSPELRRLEEDLAGAPPPDAPRADPPATTAPATAAPATAAPATTAPATTAPATTAPENVDSPALSASDGTSLPRAAPLLGRDREIARLLAVATRVGTGAPGEVVVLDGEAGAGKSTLVEDLRRRLVARGWRSAAGRCPEVTGAPPAWAWSEVAAAFDAGAGAVGEGPVATFHLARALVAALGAAGPTVVTVEDVHRGDEETLRILRSVATAAVPGVLLVVTLRADETSAGLAETLAATATVTGDRIALGGLDAPGCAALMALHGTPVDDAEAARVAGRTGGNPLFVREVARLAGTIGLAAARHTVPAGVRDVLSRRIAQLPARSVGVLRHAAVLGIVVDVEVLIALECSHEKEPGGDVEEAVLSALDAATVTGLLAEADPADPGVPGERVAFSHALIREVLYDDVPRLRRSRVHATVLDVLERAHPGDPEHAGALARHALAAGSAIDAARAVGHVLAAGRAAARACAHQAAVELLRAGLARADPPERRGGPARAGAGEGVAPETVLALRCALASALAHTGATRPAVAERQRALELASGLGRAARVAAVTCLDAPVERPLTDEEADQTDVVDLLDELLADADDTDERLRLLCGRAMILLRSDPERARADVADVAALSPRVTDPLLRCRALNVELLASTAPEDAGALDAIGHGLLAAAERAGSAAFATLGHHARFAFAVQRHDFDRAARHADEALAVATDPLLGPTTTWASLFWAMRALLEGRFEEAEGRYAAVTAAMVERGGTNAEGIGLTGLIGVRYAQGRLGELVAPLEERARLVPHLLTDPYLLALLHAGRPAEARRRWASSTHGPPRHRDAWSTLRWATRAEVALGVGDLAAATECARVLAPWTDRLAGAQTGVVSLGPTGFLLAALAEALGRPRSEAAAARRAGAALLDRLGLPDWGTRYLTPD